MSSFRFSHLLLIITSFRVFVRDHSSSVPIDERVPPGICALRSKSCESVQSHEQANLAFSASTSDPRFSYNVTIRWWYICCTVSTLPEPCRILVAHPLESCFRSFSFGQPSTSTATSTPSLFGSTPAPASNSLFGGGASGTAGNPGTPTTAPASGGLFGGGGGGLFGGGQSTAGQAQSKPAFSFGTSAPTTAPSLFGGASNAAQPATGGGGLFGSTSNTQGGGLFGQPQQQQQQQPQAGGGLFGSTNNSCVSLVSFISGASDLSISC